MANWRWLIWSTNTVIHSDSIKGRHWPAGRLRGGVLGRLPGWCRAGGRRLACSAIQKTSNGA